LHRKTEERKLREGTLWFIVPRTGGRTEMMQSFWGSEEGSYPKLAVEQTNYGTTLPEDKEQRCGPGYLTEEVILPRKMNQLRLLRCRTRN